MEPIIKPGLYITAKTLHMIDETMYTRFRQYVRRCGYRVSDDYGDYRNTGVAEEFTIRLDNDGDLVWSNLYNSYQVKNAYELTYQEIVNLLNNTPIAEVCDATEVDDLTIEEIAKRIQQTIGESNRLKKTLLKLKQALIKKTLIAALKYGD